ncbi:periplasmic substrate-binding histidine kinase [Citrifermentans bemidjiense Bem]|uniref:histidine kinase n=1 Tax=Citrifermentans bemidjiense (strain ATCC BAA-1014 / DSM 16622 / JCM 12645 / Bem) TaxID=404380 RepID=B5EIX1_CITBB|nr:transporter substrate-binding domain-containing protein [Citrifermentans bemidjiense]ACH39926.1 periplasmic substrate-binding histidine kinase [Citrifermentans bemidjiense Bem]
MGRLRQSVSLFFACYILPRCRRRQPLLVIAQLLLWALLAVPICGAAESAAGARTVIVGGDRDYPPYEFIDKSGHPAGYNVDLTRAIAEVMGMKVEFRLGGWAGMRSALQSGQVDVLQGMSYSMERSSEVDFSVPHTVVNHAVFARKESPYLASLTDLKGKTVAVHGGGIMHDYLVRQGVGAKLNLTDTPADALRMVASGRAEFAVVAIVPGMYMIRELKLSNLVPVLRNVATHRYCYAVKKGNAELLSRFNEGLAILKKTGQYDAIHNRWLGVVEPQLIDWWTFAKYAAVVVVPLVLLLGGFALWSRTLHRQVALRTADLTREIAERRQVEEELRLNQQQLVQADKMAALGVLVSGVAHEINNPTGLILLEVPILKRFHADAVKILERFYEENGDFTCGGLPYSRMRQEIPRSLEKIQDAGKRIKRIVADLKDFARRDETDCNEILDLNAAAKAAVRLVEPTIHKATTRFSAEYRKSLPRIRGNRQRIEQVLVNLILNACQALPDPERAIELTTWHDAFRDAVVLRLRDEGAGIAPEHLSRLTDPFFTTKQDQGGTGLGLSVSAGIVKEHGGILQFESNGEGTTVTLTLPVYHEENNG